MTLDSQIDSSGTQAHEIYFALGCFWGAERKFWQQAGVLETAVGYMAGQSANPDYRSVCSGTTGHAEAVKVVFDPLKISLAQLLVVFFEVHDPTQGNRQGNDVGSQYRSGIYADKSLLPQIQKGVALYQAALLSAGFGSITTEVKETVPFFSAEEYHQKYLQKNPNGYCGLSGTGVKFPLDALIAD